MRVLVTGAGGQLGRALVPRRPRGTVLRCLTHAELDIAERGRGGRRVARPALPSWSSMRPPSPRVDEAERAPAAAQRVNATGPAVLAARLRRARGAWLTHVSTDYVFDGGQSRPYGTERETSAPERLRPQQARRRDRGPRGTAARLDGGARLLALQRATAASPPRMLALMQEPPAAVAWSPTRSARRPRRAGWRRCCGP